MNKRYLLLALVILITFIGGILTGVLYSTNNAQENRTKRINIEKAAKSAIKLKTKDLPRFEKHNLKY